MNGTNFRLYRLNLVDRADLFTNRLTTDEDLYQVMLAAGTDRFDSSRESSKSGSRWSLRNVTLSDADSSRRPYIFALFSHETTWRFGTTVQPAGVVVGRATLNPAPAVTALIAVDLKRHIAAIEDVSAMMLQKRGWKSSLELILNTAALDQGFTSRFVFQEIPQRQLLEQGLGTFSRITRIRATLRIPNPDLSPLFKELYDEMLTSKVRELTQDMRNEDGINITDHKLPRMTLDMAVSGYSEGAIRIDGYNGDKKKKLTIGKEAVRISLENFVHGYEMGASGVEASRMANALQLKIDELLG